MCSSEGRVRRLWTAALSETGSRVYAGDPNLMSSRHGNQWCANPGSYYNIQTSVNPTSKSFMATKISPAELYETVTKVGKTAIDQKTVHQLTPFHNIVSCVPGTHLTSVLIGSWWSKIEVIQVPGSRLMFERTSEALVSLHVHHCPEHLRWAFSARSHHRVDC